MNQKINYKASRTPWLRWGWCLGLATLLCQTHCTPNSVQKPALREDSAEFRQLPNWAQDARQHLCEKSIELTGEMRCGNHKPAHLARSYDEAKEISERWGCIDWHFLGGIELKR